MGSDTGVEVGSRHTACSVPAASVTAEDSRPLPSSSTGSAAAGAAAHSASARDRQQPAVADRPPAPHARRSSRSMPSHTAIASARLATPSFS